MLYDGTNFDFRYPSPETPSPNEKNGGQFLKSPSKSRLGKAQQHLADNHSNHDPNSTITVQSPTKKQKVQTATPPRPSPVRPSSNFAVVIPAIRRDDQPKLQVKAKIATPAVHKTPIQTPIQPVEPPPQTPVKQPNIQSNPPSGSIVKLAVVIPDLPSTFRPEDYEVVPESPDTPQHLSRKRKQSYGDGSDGESLMTADQQEKAAAAFEGLRKCLLEIFEADDEMQGGAAISSNFLTTTSDGITLTAATQSRVEAHLQKIISVGRFSQVPLEDLLRLQKLSDNAIKEAEHIDVRIDETMSNSEIEAWSQQVSNAELGLRAARTSLRLMSGGREDKQLYSEDVIQTALNAFKNVMDTCLVPIVELRNSGSSAALFKLLSGEKKSITNLLTLCRRVLSALAILVAKIELSETVVNTLEFTTSRLIFVENAHGEKDSVIGIAKFDSLRVVAMDVLAQIFLNNPAQRQGIFDEILTSLEKLPVTKQSARQFKLPEGGSIQLVSALIMRLVQTSATKTDDTKEKRRNKALEAMNGESEADDPKGSIQTINSETRAEQQPVTAIQELRDVVSPLVDTARANASYVVAFIVNRAMSSTKTGDAPYRNLLDLFVEDFITCLSSTDWPAAELLLRLFLFKMVHLAEGEKTPAPAKNMALDLLGSMGAAISELISHVRKTASTLENGDGDLGRYLSRLAEASLEKKASAADVVSWACGPFRVSLEYLDERCSLDAQLNSAVGFYMAEWASRTIVTYDLISDEDDDHVQIEREYGRLTYRLRMMVTHRRWLSTEYSFDSVSPAHARLAYSLTLLNSQFCESFARVLTILLGSMSSEQATVRSKSMKSVNQVLETDPTILDREQAVLHLLLRCSNDPSVLVRDSALTLIGKCINLRPSLEGEMIPSILQRVNDSGIGVRKRAMKLSKDIYLRNPNADVRSSIADSLLHRVTDQDEGVQELARQTIEEVWMSPFYQPVSFEDSSAQFKLAMADHVALMVKTVQRGSGVATVLDKVLQNMLSNESKFAAANFRVCKALVATMFENIIDNSAIESNAPSARDALQVLTIFAKSNAKLFTPEQVQLLQPYIANVSGGDDLSIYRSVVIIFRHVLPHLSKVHNNFLASVRKELITAVTRMGKAILDDIVACLWIISSVLDDFQHLTRLVVSSLAGSQAMRNANFNDPAKPELIRKVSKLLLITGMFGKHCDLDPQYESFQKAFPTWKDKNHSVSKLMTDTFAPFASPDQPLEVRKSAFDAIGMVCQSWPKNFNNANISTSFKEVFAEGNPVLEAIIMRAFKEFLLLEEKRSEAGNDALVGAAAEGTAKLGVMGGGHGDGIAIGIAQQFLHDVTRIALAGKDDQALLATEVMASITRQGLVHPKECGPSLIALETSPNTKIADLAFRAHRALHEKHETILEKEYTKAIQLAYVYQRDVVKDHHGATLNPFAPKLHLMIDVLKISKVKNRKKFFENLCEKIDFDPAKLGLEELPHHLEFSQFIIENMAFFEYASVDELLSAISAMEKVVAGTGTGIAHAIETEIFHVSLDQPTQVDENGQSQPMEPTVDSTRLLQLAASSMMLSCLWQARSYLRRQYGLMTNRRESKGKATTKDLNKAPTKAQGVTGDKFWEEVTSTMSALETEETMKSQCHAFVELLTVDQDFKIAAEADDEIGRVRLGTPSEDEENGTPGPPGSGRGRKRKAGNTPGGRKKRARSSSVPRARGRPKGLGKKTSVDADGEDENAWD